MARLARVVLPGVPHHVTQRGVRSMDIFSNSEDRKFYLDQLQSSSEEFGLTVLSWCLMNNHVHLLVVPEKEESLRSGIGAIHRNYTRRFNLREKTTGFLFQGRFFSCPLDDKYLTAALKYVALNPVRAGICEQASEYEWSSAKYYLGLDSGSSLIKNKNWFGSPADWEKLLESDTEEIDLLRMHFRTGRPLGNEKFLQAAEKITGRELIPKKPGRKKGNPLF